jgi:hypothetical protein
LGTRAAIGILLLVTGGCASRDESLGCAELVVTCPGDTSDQQWWLASDFTSTSSLEPQSGHGCGSWLAFIRNDATARYDQVDLGAREGEMRLRVVVAADDASTHGGTLTLFADSDMTTSVATCPIGLTGGWFNWLVVDCGVLSLRGLHSLTFKFYGKDPTDPYVFNFAAFGVVRSGSPDCTVTGPKR